MRTLVLAAGVLLVAALATFLAIGHWRVPFDRRDIPKRLGIDIQQEANGVTYTQARGGRTLFKIHASRVVQLRNEVATLHDVQIELYGADGKSVDRITGNEFEYDQKAGEATAAGPVQLWLMRPGTAPAIAPKAAQDAAKGAAARGEIHVETSGLTFDQKSGVVTTQQKVIFSMPQGQGTSLGARYDAQAGRLELSHTVELETARGGDPVAIRAASAEMERTAETCQMRSAQVSYRDEEATAGAALVHFRQDGSVAQLDASEGFVLSTKSGGRMAAPRATLDFDTHNQPQHGRLLGGVRMDDVSAGRQVHGTAPEMELSFAAEGRLRHAHLERGVELHSEELTQPKGHGKALPVRVTRSWRSPVVDVDFRSPGGSGRVEPSRIVGAGGVTIAEQSQRGNEKPVPARLAADEMTGEFGAGTELTALTGVGHASMEETTASGARLVSSGDSLVAHFAEGGKGSGAEQVQAAVLQGHVVLVEQPQAKPGTAAQAPLRATAERASYESTGEQLHLTGSPRVENGGLQLAANTIDVSQETGDAYARGDVKATWTQTGAGAATAGMVSVPLGGDGPAHAIAEEAQLHQASGEAVFRGHARLWQQADSISAPVITLDRQKQTLHAQSADAAEPVRAVLSAAQNTAERKPRRNGNGPGVIRVRGGDLWYSDGARKAMVRGGKLGAVVAQAGTATSSSDQVALTLLPAGQHAKRTGQGEVDTMTASGHVVVSSQGRRGTGEQLKYTSATGQYVLTGAAGAPPRLTDPQRGSVTGTALIFNSRDDSVIIEGGGHETTTETTAPR